MTPRWRGWRRRKAPRGLASDDALFVIGPARSGTTILQNALNDARDIFLLGEPDLHLDAGETGFAARYNAMHESWANQPTKSSYLPPVIAEDGPWPAHLDRLAALHRVIGSKIVVNPGKAADWEERFLHFHCGRFYTARYLFVFRHPRPVLASTISFQLLGGAAPTSAAAVLANYAQTLALFTRLVRTLPHVRALIHEDIDATRFASLSDWLGVPLAGAPLYYDAARVRRQDEPALGAREAHALDLLSGVFEDLRAELAVPSGRLQIEQNRRSPDISHLTGIGSIDGRATMIERYLTVGPDPGGPAPSRAHRA